MLKKKLLFLVLIGALFVSGCSQHQKLMKSTDNEVKYEAAVDYFEDGDYYRALQLFEQLIGVFRGTSKAEKLYYYYSYCYYYQEEYLLASYYFKRYAKSFPNGPNAEESFFMSAYCQYMLSPRYSLDQTNTHEAIKELQLFINFYPESERVETCNQLIDELRAKLEKKDFEIARQYLKTEHYKAAITAFNNLLRDYPDTDNKEDILFFILKSYHKYAENSIEKMKGERYEATVEAFNDFIYSYPESDYAREASVMQNDALEALEKL
ncbi:MAG: outer membrane protein assembly factor BamD [Bacteroidales bacterium]